MPEIGRWINIATGLIAIIGVVYLAGVTVASVQTKLEALEKEVATLRDEGGIPGEKGEKGDPGRIPSGAVVAFATTCPQAQGWSPYKEAEGRFILGVGKGPLENFVGLGTPGGKEEVELTIEEMPAHSHSLTWTMEENPKYPLNWNGQGGGPSIPSNVEKFPPLMQGYNEPHNNMPPYIPLYFCKKD